MAEEMKLSKDDATINYRTKQKDNLKKIAEALENEDNLAESLGIEARPYENQYDHEMCQKAETETVTEKRRCRCYFYINSRKEGCDRDCPLHGQFPTKIADKFQFIDYEVPVGNTEKVGNIDLLLQHGGKTYALEVKPPKSDETLARMLAETLTYTYLANQNESTLKKYGSKQFQPAIAFFAGSKQKKDYEKCKKDDNLKIIWKKVAVFLLTENSDKDCLDIKRIDLTENL